MRDSFTIVGKNQLNENVRRMRDIQKKCKQKETEKAVPVKPLWKSEKYNNVESKIRTETMKPLTPRPGSGNYLRAHSRAGPPVRLDSRSNSPVVSNKISVPLADSANDVHMIRNSFDFIKINGMNAKRATVQRPPSAQAKDDLERRKDHLMSGHSFGQVPSYLRRRKDEWKKTEEERIANTPDPSMPPGHRQLPEGERQETLTLLNKKQDDVVNQIQRLPIGADTFRVKNQRQSLEKQLVEVEEAIKIFSRPKVFVRVD